MGGWSEPTDIPQRIWKQADQTGKNRSYAANLAAENQSEAAVLPAASGGTVTVFQNGAFT